MSTKGTNREHIKTETARSKVATEARSIGRDLVGVDDFRRSKFGYLTGYSAFREAAVSSFAPAVALWQTTKKMAKATFSREKVVPLPTNATDPHERFLVAAQVYGNTEEDIALRLKRSAWLTITLGLLFLGGFLYGLIFFHEIGEFLPVPLNYIFPFYLQFLIFALYLKYSFYNYQLRHRALYSFWKFMREGAFLDEPTFRYPDKAKGGQS